MRADATTEQLGAEIRGAISRIYTRLRSFRSEGEIGEAALTVLAQLEKQGRLSLTELSAAARVTPGSMSQTVNRLTQAGYAVRRPDPEDGRRVLFELTAGGRALIAEDRGRRHGWLNARLDELSPSERQTLARASTILRKIADS